MTPFEEIFEKFLDSPVIDRKYDLYTEDEIRAELLSFLLVAIMKFKNPHIPLDYEGDHFNERLSDAEINVLIALMKHEWSKTFINDDYHLKQRPSFREANFSSSAQHLRMLMEREKRAKQEAFEAVAWYSRDLSNFKKLGGKNGEE